VPEGDVFYAVGRDITAEKEAAAELEAAQEALRQSQKMEAMGQLTGGVAHDFNNLLTPIVGSLDMLQRRRVGSEREQRLIAGAALSAERARTLVQRLLAFARRQPLQPVAVDLGKLVTGMIDLVASTSGPRVKVEVDLASENPAVIADPNQLEMAILNLAVNARDAMPDGGSLIIAAREEALRDGAALKLERGRYVRLSVSDTGVGMDAEIARRAVEPFFSTKGVGRGTGLGLSMVHGLAAQLGGAMRIESRLGVGTTVELWLPVAEAVASDVEQVGPALAAAKAGTVLLVDDEELVRASTADMLSELGYEVTEVASAEEALRLIGNGLGPDVVVTDHLMPGLTGTDFARLLKEREPAAKVLVISGYAEDEGVAPDLPRLTKPFRQAELAESLAKLTQESVDKRV
jgi:nitrogen-specific signal transduction histidine kinase/CheY-like chemotaxis protein